MAKQKVEYQVYSGTLYLLASNHRTFKGAKQAALKAGEGAFMCRYIMVGGYMWSYDTEHQWHVRNGKLFKGEAGDG